ncbi:MAG: AbrB/MazE/SpoVT family DNA-binding domain-containing protein [Terriglobales bacterium]
MEASGNVVRTKLGPGGRIVIPRAMRQALGIKPGDELMLRMEEDELGDLRVYTLERAIKRAQRFGRRYARPGESVVDSLIADRRAEAAREAAETEAQFKAWRRRLRTRAHRQAT